MKTAICAQSLRECLPVLTYDDKGIPMDEKKTPFQIHTGIGVIVILLVITAIYVSSGSGYTDTEIADKVKSGKVLMFSTSSCKYCEMVRDLFNENRVAYLEMNIDTSEKARALFQAIGGRGVPLTFIGDLRIEGYHKPTLLSAIRQLKSL